MFRTFMKALKEFMADEMGQAAADVVVGLGITLVVISIILPIGAFVVGKTDDALNTGDLDTDAQTAINDTFDNTYSGFQIASISPIAYAGVAVVGIVMTFMGMVARPR